MQAFPLPDTAGMYSFPHPLCYIFFLVLKFNSFLESKFGIALNVDNVTIVKLFASSAKDMNEWLTALQKVIRNIEEKRKEHSGTS